MHSFLAVKSFIKIILLMAVVLVVSSNQSYAQEEISRKEKKEQRAKKRDSTRVVSPHKATLWAMLPGAGQIYNRKYWKLPIVYAGFAVTGYFAFSNRSEYLKYKDAYVCLSKAESDSTFTCENPLSAKYSKEQLSSYADYTRRNMELSFILMGVWYILQILDATVDAHLYHWDVNENLSMRVEPIFQPVYIPTVKPSYNGLKVTFSF